VTLRSGVEDVDHVIERIEAEEGGDLQANRQRCDPDEDPNGLSRRDRLPYPGREF
jgi:hypothetical protein